ncbi:hypothetical protein [Bacillus sp. V5-8f]|uniref:hypothetical protein n=1 Tax=Bacillus sp. V5-8f TaxID=2053044 RepID=UPI000C764D18|nr:hypothetical protein [Bacillus sp. V5-8f]PLT33538.1 hypothetical protein CUU64_13300 [Bacillus sp. V5-8f]
MLIKQKTVAELKKGNIYTEQDVYNFFHSNQDAIVLSEDISKLDPSNTKTLYFIKDKITAFVHTADSSQNSTERKVIYHIKHVFNRS